MKLVLSWSLSSSLLAGSYGYNICCSPVNIVAFAQPESVLPVLLAKEALTFSDFSSSASETGIAFA